MKALIISSLLFFSLRAMSSEVEVGENKKSPCPHANQDLKRSPKVVIEESVEKPKPQEASVVKGI